MSSHHHGGSAPTNARRVLFVLALVSCFVVAELLAATLGHSLALLADAGHMVTDVVALATTAWVIRLSALPAAGRWTYGLKRAEIISAAFNGVTLVAVGFFIAVESVQRLVSPAPVSGAIVLWTALAGAVVNVIGALVLRPAHGGPLHLRAAYVHILTDLYAFAGTAAAGVVIVVTGWRRADAVASLAVVALIFRTAWNLLRDAGRILLQATPDHLNLREVRAHLEELPQVLAVHDLHAWSVTSGMVTLSAHVVVGDDCFAGGRTPEILDQLQSCVATHFGIEHATFQIEPATHASHEEGLHT